jgi:hypothetical protein
MERPEEFHRRSGNCFSVQWIEHLEARVAELEADCVSLAMSYLGVSPDRNTQTAAEVECEEARLLETARKHNPYAVK